MSPIAFCLFVALLAVLLFAVPDKAYSDNEKRYLAQKPTVTWESIVNGSFSDEIENWIADQFPGRDLWVGIHAYFSYLTGRNAQQNIYLAKNGYLINAPSNDDLTMFKTSIGRFEKFAQTTGLPASMILVPSTGYLKEDLLPVGHKDYADDRMFDYAKENTDNITFVDLRDALFAADAEFPVAYRTDHHLTSYGNYTLYQNWRMMIGKDFLQQDNYSVETVDGFYGTTWSGSGYWLTEPDSVELWNSGADVSVVISDGGEADVTADSLFFRTHLEEKDMYPVFLDGNHTLTTITNPDAAEGTLLVIKDSYAHGFVPFLADHYQTIYMIDLRFYRGKVSEFAVEHNVDELLFLYGASTLLTDSNSAWLF